MKVAVTKKRLSLSIVRSFFMLTPRAEMKINSSCLHAQIVEIDYRVSFRPQTNFSRALESVVGSFDFLVSIVVTGDPVPDSVNSQFVPLPRSHFKFRSSKFAPMAIYNTVQL